MHTYALVQIASSMLPSSRDDIPRVVDSLLAPYNENLDCAPRLEDCSWCDLPGTRGVCDICDGKGRVITTLNPDGRWDWYQIGGRWSCLFHPDPDYDPESDPRNINSDGTIKWPTEWALDLEHDYTTVASLIDFPDDRLVRYIPYSVLDETGTWIDSGDSRLESGSSFRDWLTTCQLDTICVVVDMHC